MRTLRKLHLYLGCIFAPMIIYFSLSGIWQVFRFNDIPKEAQTEVSVVRIILHAASNPHTHSTLPGRDPKTQQSPAFNYLAALMGLGMILTSTLGIILALRFSSRPMTVILCLLAGIFVPAVMLLS